MSHTGEQTDSHKNGDILIPSKEWGGCISANCNVVEGNLNEIKQKLAHYKPRIIAVTKYYGLDAIVNGYKVGLRDFGESRVGDAIEKIEMLSDEIRTNSVFHFIGHLQTNKVEKVVKYFDYIHSVDSLKVAEAISKSACKLNKRERILLQVNNANEAQKFGYSIEQLEAELDKILALENIEVVGLMNMATLGASEGESKRLFGELRELKEKLEQEHKVVLQELSMGMSDDYIYAVSEGATMIRIGRKLFK